MSSEAVNFETPAPVRANHSITGPSSLYRAEFWRVGVFMARRLPHFLLGRTASNLAKIYWLACPRRRRVVFENLLPAVHGDRLAARVATRELFQQFALKLADLWRYESGLSINVMYTVDDGGKRAVGFKLSDGMEIPEEWITPRR